MDGETTYFGNRKTQARYLREENQWKMETYVFNTTALSEEISKRFMLGKHDRRGFPEVPRGKALHC